MRSPNFQPGARISQKISSYYEMTLRHTDLVIRDYLSNQGVTLRHRNLTRYSAGRICNSKRFHQL